VPPSPVAHGVGATVGKHEKIQAQTLNNKHARRLYSCCFETCGTFSLRQRGVITVQTTPKPWVAHFSNNYVIKPNHEQASRLVMLTIQRHKRNIDLVWRCVCGFFSIHEFPVVMVTTLQTVEINSQLSTTKLQTTYRTNPPATTFCQRFCD